MKEIVKIGKEVCWESPDGEARQMGVLFERDITPTRNMSAGTVLLPVGGAQIKLSSHEDSEEIYYVVKGRGSFILGNEEHEVEAGHAVYVAPGTPHRSINTGNEPMLLLWVNSPPVFRKIGEYREYVKDWKQVR